MAFPLLNISPSQLEFLFEADRELKTTLNLRNVHEGVRIAFKIKTTNSERFVVCPPSGIVEPGTTRLVKVYLKAQRAYDDELRFCKDRFLVQSIVVDPSMDEQDITSNLFKSGQRQEAKLKVVVAAPLAHASVLENEIRTIAMRQGVEGHRAVVRKFSELLLARGIISQAQVVLAFSTVGEIFQGMQNAYRASTADREKTFQQFLGGLPDNKITANGSEKSSSTTPSLTFPKPSQGLAPLSAAALPALSRAGKPEAAVKAADGKAASPPAPGTPAADVSGAKQPPVAASDSGSPQEEGGGGPVRLNSANEGDYAFVDPAARAPWAPEAMNALFDADGVRIDENKMGGALETTELRADTKFIPLSIAHPAAQRQLVFDAPSGAADTPDDTTGKVTANGGPEPRVLASLDNNTMGADAKAQAKARNSTAARKVGEPALPSVGDMSQPTDEPSTPTANVPPADRAGASVDSPSRIVLLTEVQPEEFDAAREAAAQDVSNQKGADSAANGIIPDSSSTEKAERPLSGKASWPSGYKDSLGRINPVTGIDRLATPAIRKSAAKKPVEAATPSGTHGIKSDGSHTDGSGKDATDADSQANSLDGPGGTRPQAAASEEGLSPQISRDGDENLRTQDSIRSITSTGSGSLGVPIPSGNTLKMANLFNKSKKQQA